MLRDEANTIGRLLNSLPADSISPVVNLGSSTRVFREVYQPFISELLFQPLASRGVSIVHADIKPDDGVDIVGDIDDPSFQARLRETGARLVLCSNMLEHI